MRRKRILLTGLPGCGKTTVVRKVADLLRGNASGFYTEEVRDDKGQRTGFQVTSLDGKRGELARKEERAGPRVGSYRVNVKSFEQIALPSLEEEKESVLIIDEIGKMECCSEEFIRRVEQAFDSGRSILATIPLRGGGDFIESIRRRKDVETVLVTRENRETLQDQLAAKLSLPRQGRGPQGATGRSKQGRLRRDRRRNVGELVGQARKAYLLPPADPDWDSRLADTAINVKDAF